MRVRTWAIRLTVAALVLQTGLFALLRLAPDWVAQPSPLSTLVILVGLSQCVLVAAFVALAIWTIRLRQRKSTNILTDAKWLTASLAVFLLAAFATLRVGEDLQLAVQRARQTTELSTPAADQ